MTEVWKSQAKKFCTICKCWFADNKVSIQHHEEGTRHKAAVQEKLRDLGRMGVQREKDARSTSAFLKQMKTGAIASYKKDVRESPDVANRYNIHQNLNAVSTKGVKSSSVSSLVSAQNAVYGPQTRTLAPSAADDTEKEWAETESPEGHIYYWNVKSGEAVWTKPDAPVMSLAEQRRQNELALLASAASSSKAEDQATDEPPSSSKGVDAQLERALETADRVTSVLDAAGGTKKKKRRQSPDVKLEDDDGARRRESPEARLHEYSVTDDFRASGKAGTSSASADPKMHGVKAEPTADDDTKRQLQLGVVEKTNKAKRLEREKQEREIMRVELEKHHREKQMREQANPYGQWNSVPEQQEEKLPQLDLPPEADANFDYSQQQFVAVHADPDEVRPVSFKERTVGTTLAKKGHKTLAGGKTTTFKRRTPAASANRRTNRTDGDDDD